jgi:hypothetical protein
MRVCARLTNHEHQWLALINSHPRLTGASELTELSCKLSLLNSHHAPHPRLTGALELTELSCKLSLLNLHQLSSSFDWRIRVDRTLVQTLASQLSFSFYPAFSLYQESSMYLKILTAPLVFAFQSWDVRLRGQKRNRSRGKLAQIALHTNISSQLRGLKNFPPIILHNLNPWTSQADI